ncbi:surfeit locus protein 6 homolog [Malaya genurostris]|uniref:surfeit locus protein 6 homolog n=1 Tax=Malaya genurostris TaxID=325434 RepID=UPI0026F39466|nr:surfeit locus protein 6 homolog [Malaya genurostris]
MGTQTKFELLELLNKTNDKYLYLLEAFKIPSANTDKNEHSDLLLQDTQVEPDDSEEERNTQLKVMQNKISSKCIQRKRKKMGATKSIQKPNKFQMRPNVQIAEKNTNHNGNTQIKKEKELLPVYNEMGKIVFPKIQFDENDVSKKGVETDAKKMLRQVLKEQKQLNDLKSSGDTTKYEKIKNAKSWNRATAKVLGQKIRDDVGLLSTKINRRKKQVSKSKQEWSERIKKVDRAKHLKQTKRMENIKQRATQKKNKKMKKLANKGRIIPGF